MGILRQYAIGDRASPHYIRLVNRPLQERYNRGGYGESHISYLLGSGDKLREQEVLGDGYCWLRAIVMQIAASSHGKKIWDADTGETQSLSRTAGRPQTLRSSTQKGARMLEALNKEITCVVEGLAEFIANNPILLQEASDNANNNTEIIGWETLEVGRLQYEFMQANKLKSRAEDYTMVNHPHKTSWVSRLNAEFKVAGKVVKNVAVCWTNSYEGAAELVRRFEVGEWTLAHKLGMVTKRGTTEPITIKNYVTEVVPDLVSEQEWVEL